MVTSRETARIFSAVADPTRRAILDALREHRLSAGAVAARFPISRPAISRHLRVLRQAGLVCEARESRMRWYSLAPSPLQAIDHWVKRYREFWDPRPGDHEGEVVSGDRRDAPAEEPRGVAASRAMTRTVAR